MSPTDVQTKSERRAAARAARQAQEAAAARAAARRRRLGVLGGVVALAAALVVALLALTAPEDAAPPTPATSALEGIPQDGRFLGSPDAPVTLVEFADLQCPFCRDFAVEALPTLVEEQVRTGRLRLEFRPRTFLGPDSVTAAQAVVAAGRQDRLWNVLEGLFAAQGPENGGWVTPDLVEGTLRAAGADPGRALEVAAGAGVARDLREADDLAARYGLDGTPAFLIGPTGGELRPLQVQALTGEFFSDAVDAELAAAT